LSAARIREPYATADNGSPEAPLERYAAARSKSRLTPQTAAAASRARRDSPRSIAQYGCKSLRPNRGREPESRRPVTPRRCPAPRRRDWWYETWRCDEAVHDHPDCAEQADEWRVARWWRARQCAQDPPPIARLDALEARRDRSLMPSLSVDGRGLNSVAAAVEELGDLALNAGKLLDASSADRTPRACSMPSAPAASRKNLDRFGEPPPSR